MLGQRNVNVIYNVVPMLAQRCKWILYTLGQRNVNVIYNVVPMLAQRCKWKLHHWGNVMPMVWFNVVPTYKLTFAQRKKSNVGPMKLSTKGQRWPGVRMLPGLYFQPGMLRATSLMPSNMSIIMNRFNVGNIGICPVFYSEGCVIQT